MGVLSAAVFKIGWCVFSNFGEEMAVFALVDDMFVVLGVFGRNDGKRFKLAVNCVGIDFSIYAIVSCYETHNQRTFFYQLQN